MEDNKFIDIPLGDGNGFDTTKMPQEQSIKSNQVIVDNVIGINEDGTHKIPNKDEWKKIDEYNQSSEIPLREMDPVVFTKQQETEDWDYYVNNLKENIKNNSMSDQGNIKSVRKENDKVKKIGVITSSILAICILSSATVNTINDIKTKYPGQDINQTTIENYINYKKENIKTKYLEFNDKIDKNLEFYLEPRSESGTLYKDLIPEQITNGSVPVEEYSIGGK